ncbi:MAG: hypothetical protein IT429_00405, partial [Gemmataceae bacterium]|nr:hypothetical protein [Gemmataceae bacterium]
MIPLLLCGPLLVWTAVRHGLPLGYAGLFALMAELVAANGFRLPEWVPWYGPGGMPFAYPPLGFYVMAGATAGLGVPTLAYLAWAPALFCVAFLVPFYFL